MQSQITFSQALEGYLLYADVRHLSPHTIADYTNTFRKLQTWLGDDPPSPLSPLTRSAPFSHASTTSTRKPSYNE